MSFILAQGEPGLGDDEICRRIERQTGLQTMTRDEFAWTTIFYYLKRTGIPVNFGITVALGFVVGTAIAGQTFYLFTIENLRQFGTLKAMGAGNAAIMGMVMVQAAVVGLIGYGLGVGAAALFGEFAKGVSRLAFFMPWQVLLATGAAVLLMVMLVSLLSLRRVLALEPAVVFRG